MFARATHSLAFLLLIPLSGTAAAQAWSSERPETETPRDPEAPVFWQKAPDDAMQTFVGIRHNADAGTVVGLSLRPPGYPAFLLEVEVVPHGYGPLEDDKELSTPSSSLAPESQSLRSVHKLSLRYRF
jgi:hypothetical protein